AAHPLPALGALEQECATEAAQLRECGDRRLEIGHPLADDRLQPNDARHGACHARSLGSRTRKDPRSHLGTRVVVPPDLDCSQFWKRALSLRDHAAPGDNGGPPAAGTGGPPPPPRPRQARSSPPPAGGPSPWSHVPARTFPGSL